jgi:hypothetical protein
LRLDSRGVLLLSTIFESPEAPVLYPQRNLVRRKSPLWRQKSSYNVKVLC